MLAPKCRTCGTAHWSTQPCPALKSGKSRGSAAKSVKIRAQAAKPAPAVTHAERDKRRDKRPAPGKAAGRAIDWQKRNPEQHAANQRAYRARKKSA
ncbi:MAG: hypothetical protein KIS96_11575 [Bauldia sp.]|nr:hypothetical protein [Bauldia sp.]